MSVARAKFVSMADMLQEREKDEKAMEIPKQHK